MNRTVQIFITQEYSNFLNQAGLDLYSERTQNLNQRIFEYFISNHVQAWDRNGEPDQKTINRLVRQYLKNNDQKIILEKISMFFKDYSFSRIMELTDKKELDDLESLVHQTVIDPKSFDQEYLKSFFELYELLLRSVNGGLARIRTRDQVFQIVKPLVLSKVRLHYIKGETAQDFPIIDESINLCSQISTSENFNLNHLIDLRSINKLFEELEKIYNSTMRMVETSYCNIGLSQNEKYIFKDQKKFIDSLYHKMKLDNKLMITSMRLLLKTIKLLQTKPLPKELCIGEKIVFIKQDNYDLSIFNEIERIFNINHEISDVFKFIAFKLKENQRTNIIAIPLDKQKKIFLDLLKFGPYSKEGEEGFKMVHRSLCESYDTQRKKQYQSRQQNLFQDENMQQILDLKRREIREILNENKHLIELSFQGAEMDQYRLKDASCLAISKNCQITEQRGDQKLNISIQGLKDLFIELRRKSIMK